MKTFTTNTDLRVLWASSNGPIAAMHGTALPFAAYGSGAAGIGADARRTRVNAAQDPPRGRPV